MKVQSFEYMRTQYRGNRDLEPDDLNERVELLKKFKHSLIVEGGHMEFDNLHKWIKTNFGPDSIKEIYFGKTDYDYGFAEFFLCEQTQEEKLRQAVPNIYTTYPFSDPPNKISKSDGCEKDIQYSQTNKDAIIYPADIKS